MTNTNYVTTFGPNLVSTGKRIDAVKASFGTTSMDSLMAIFREQDNHELFIEYLYHELLRKYMVLLDDVSAQDATNIPYAHLNDDRTSGKLELNHSVKYNNDNRIFMTAGYENQALLEMCITFIPATISESANIDLEITRLWIEKSDLGYSSYSAFPIEMQDFLVYDQYKERKFLMIKYSLLARFDEEYLANSIIEFFWPVFEAELELMQLVYNDYLTVDDVRTIVWEGNEDMNVSDILHIKKVMDRAKKTENVPDTEETSVQEQPKRRYRVKSTIDPTLKGVDVVSEG